MEGGKTRVRFVSFRGGPKRGGAEYIQKAKWNHYDYSFNAITLQKKMVISCANKQIYYYMHL